ncbi:exodeoxyribonuclease III [Solimonas marina]|uniref:Exodeoxyribonuclease III n=1 Tax=Solimonas marina TaxID=2714601 RepID=A0A970B9Z2_9GAMM|nr:exodeoxyribonuclease III [Solimonas marina]NKF22851.1 exodeoxyribonuclease III [Solimonas marina]
MRIATWNVNSLKVRLPHLLDWLRETQVDVVALQELKMIDDAFPHDALAELGYRAVTNGQKTYNGVALLARHEIADVVRDMDGFVDEQKRVIAATIGGIRFVSVYVVNGQSVGSEKYAYKLRFLDALYDYLAGELEQHPLLAVGGDYNIAPAPEDTHDPQVWEGGVLCSEPEREALQKLMSLGLLDAFRLFPQAANAFTWWDYRQAAFRRNLGLRIDHWLLSTPLAAAARSAAVDLAPRKLERPSDHAPLVVELADT